ncbi:MAG: DUF5666 domain-containing protein, partial [Candidatus Sericytochromatia bacterium]
KEESSYSENIKVKFYGNVKSYSLKYPSVWIIKDKKVLVNKETEIDEEHGKISNNSYVEVKGFYDNKNLVATKIEVRKNEKVKENIKNKEKFEFYGNVKSYSLKYPSVWIIKDKKVLVNKETEIDEEYEKISNNSYVEVKGFYDNKNLVATKIEVKKNNSQLKKEGK